MMTPIKEIKKILLTGGSGTLGSRIITSKIGDLCIYPKHEELDICNLENVEEYIIKNKPDIVLHCAALARVGACQKNPTKAIKINVLGTSNLVISINKHNPRMRFIYISTDAVYLGEKGNYSEKDATLPFNVYGCTKLASECVVKTLVNHCIIRTSFFKEEKVSFESSPVDSFHSKMRIDKLVDAIALLALSDFKGTVNVGSKRNSLYALYKEYNKELKPISIRDIEKDNPNILARDSSMNIELWKKLRNELNLKK